MKQILSKYPMVQAGHLAIELHPAMLADFPSALMDCEKKRRELAISSSACALVVCSLSPELGRDFICNADDRF
jgi:hypothetical protein